MKRRSVEAIVGALNETGARYLVVGGLAVVAHGYLRLTADLDLMLDLEAADLRRPLGALAELGYAPHAPVALLDFADAAKRACWVRDKGLRVFSLHSDRHPSTEVDLFVDDPLGFDDAYQRALLLEVAPGVRASFVGFDDLLRLKRAAGRPQDLVDIEKLETLRKGETDE